MLIRFSMHIDKYYIHYKYTYILKIIIRTDKEAKPALQKVAWRKIRFHETSQTVL